MSPQKAGQSWSVISLRVSPRLRSVAVSGDGKVLATAGYSEPVAHVRVLRHNEAINGVALSPDGRRALSSGYDGRVRLWDVETGRELKQVGGQPDFVLSVVFTPDGRHAVTAGGSRTGADGPEAGEDFAIRVWELPGEQGR